MPTNIIPKRLDTYLKALHERGVHFVLCLAKDQGARKSKSAIQKGWQNKPPALKHVQEHVQAGGLLGFIPGKSGLWVLDVDRFPGEDKGTDGLLANVSTLATVSTPRGVHAYFKKSTSAPIANRAWSTGSYGGDVRGDNGYCIAWELGKLAGALDKLTDAETTSTTLFPKPPKAHAAEGNRNNAMNADIFGKARRGQTEFSKERAAGIAAGMTPGEVADTIHSASGAGKALTFPRKDADALEGALGTLGITLRYNLRAMQAEISNGGGTWTKTTDRSSADLRRLIAGKFSYRLARKQEIAPLKYGKDSWDEHLNALLYHRETDPFKDWLEGLPEWDGKKRLIRLLPDCLGALDGPLTRWAGTYLTLGAVQRTYEPGGLLREIPIIIGPQRAGKSQLLSNLLPPEHPDWFSDSVCVSDPTQKRVEGMLGRVIVELSELTGFRRAELESLKAFISRRDDGATRLAYRRDPETALRRCILAGTSNDTECLPADPSGNTRFVPIQCGEGSHVEPYLAERRDQLWAEGLAIYRKGERANLPRSMMHLQAEHGELHRRKDPVIEDAVAAIVGEGPLTIIELFRMACPSISPSDRRAVSRLADALRLAGWQKKRERTEGGGLAYLWRRGTK